MQRVLFICSQNMLRSPTAEEVFKAEPGFEVSSAGTDVDAERPVTAEMLAWADIVVVMQNHHQRQLLTRFEPVLRDKRIVVLGIPDNYERMDPALVERLHSTSALWKSAPETELPVEGLP
jgi:predicted protein tyrosine phosphatase